MTHIAAVMNSTKSFIVLTGHFIDESSAMMQSFCLGAKQLQPHHPAIHIKEDLKVMLDQFKVDKSKIVSAPTDGGANILAAVRILLGSSRLHIPCLAHMINLVVQNSIDAVPEFKEICEKVKALVTYFKRSNVAMDDLRAEQAREEESEGTFLYLIQDLMTRWNPTFHALHRFITLSGYIGKILLLGKHKNAPPMLTPMEVDVVRDCIAVLKPFEIATKEISGEKYVTVSMVISIINFVRGQLQKTSPESATAKKLKFQLEDKMNRRMADLEKVELLAVSTVLDPRFKKLHFQSAINASTAIAVISREVRHQLHALDEQLSSSFIDEAPPDPKNLWSIHDKEAAKNAPESPSLTGHSLPHELKLYLQQPFQARTSNPIKFWRDGKNAFPGTYRVTMKYLTVLGTSVPSERTVSRLNYVASDSRSRLTAVHTDMLVFPGSLDEKLWFA
ncbi:zinc finger BED domain-containing protein 4-like [Diprion similis]|uniref:zinc finger BED domain-containing protein 4-like n=1 Tax=Diprion similis TaxID=362088 RepID=UPI001EF8482C|nr:zinc finger BED domain-containing protein 4-like [Diprion similis]